MVEQVLLRIYNVSPPSPSLSLSPSPSLSLSLTLLIVACALSLLLHAVFFAVAAEGSILHAPFVGSAGTHECVCVCALHVGLQGCMLNLISCWRVCKHLFLIPRHLWPQLARVDKFTPFGKKETDRERSHSCLFEMKPRNLAI